MGNFKVISCYIMMVALLAIGLYFDAVSARSGEPSSAPVIAGRSLHYWIAQAANPERSEKLDTVIAALMQAVQSDDLPTKVAGADTLAVLGARAKKAMPVLIDQLGHEQPWVRVAAMGALSSIGKVAVPALCDTIKNKTGGPRIRSAFVLGGIGPDAKDAIPVLVEIMKTESDANKIRLGNILNQIDPEHFTGDTSPSGTGKKIQFDPQIPTELTQGSVGWPQFHGPKRDSICRERGLLNQWPKEGPKLLWKIKGLGKGFSTVSISYGRIFTMGDRINNSGQEQQFALAYDLKTRRQLWATPVGEPFKTGPRCTPTVDGDRVYVLGTEGDLLCLKTTSGTILWQKNLIQDFGGKMMSGWKFCESPLIDGNRLICTPGADDAALIALDKHTGKLIWKSTMPDMGKKGSNGAGYSSAIAAEIAGVRQYIQILGRGVIGVEAATGRFLWGYNKIANNIANITSPIVRGNYVFISTAYNTGSALLQIKRNGKNFRAEEMYFVSPRDFQNHHGGVVLVDDYIYGGHGPNKGDPACVELATGKVAWKVRSPSRGSAGVLYADGHLIFRYDRGDVLLVEATPKEFRVKGRFLPPTGKGPAWPHPVIHQGRLFLRHGDLLLCYDLRAYK
jgi:outer membrane protein assembly factor BamB